MLHAKRIGIFRNGAEAGDKRIGKPVRNLQRHTQQHREDEEHRHLAVLEQQKRLQSQCLHQRLASSLRTAHRTFRQRLGIYSQHHAPHRTRKELHIVRLESQQIYQPHGTDETDGAERTYRRKSLDGVQSRLIQRRIGHRIRQSQRRHVECHTHGVEREQRCKFHLRSRSHGIVARSSHKQGCQQMAQPQQPLRRNPAVGNDTQHSRHKQGHNPLHGVKNSDMSTQSHACQVRTHRSKIGPPHSKLQEVHDNQSQFHIHILIDLLKVISSS